METGKLNEIKQEDWQEKKPRLSWAIIEAVSSVINHATGKVPACLPAGFSTSETGENPEQLAMVVAYTRLYVEEPEMVTSRHKKMLRKAFSYEQIQDLNELIKKMIQ